MRSAFLKFASLLLILALVSAGLFACDKEEPPVDDDPETVDSGEDSESESDGGSESEEDTDGDESDEPKSEIFEDVSGKSMKINVPTNPIFSTAKLLCCTIIQPVYIVNANKAIPIKPLEKSY